jgi:MerR family copper efflux transcriptional regulator
MLISEFARETGLSRETVRFYTRLGLLLPQTTEKGGRHPYMHFRRDDIRAVELIRIGQALDLSLEEIARLLKRRTGKLSRSQRIELMKTQLDKLDAKSAELDKLRAYVRAKILWQENGEKGPEPHLDALKLSNGHVDN